MSETVELLRTSKIHYESTTSYKLIYVFRVNDDAHEGLLKIGDASVDTNLPYQQLTPNCNVLNQAAKARINQYSVTLGINYQLLYTEIAVREKTVTNDRPVLDIFRDYNVHDVLIRSGVEKVHPNGTNANEWFRIDLETVKNAIKAVKEGRKSLYGREITDANQVEIILREEQEDAIHKTIEVFKHSDQMLWNAKMRYGKTVTALSLVKREISKYKKTLIITHRPVVKSGWSDDFKLIFKNGECDFAYKETETEEEIPEEIEKIDYANELQLKELERSGKPFIYFASIQDLRGSRRVGGKFNKNNAVFNMEWDLIINDEAHEGTQTELGQNVAAAIKKKHTKLLSLSGTPFNIMYQFDEDSVYTWDYVMEQARKNEWDKTHPGDPNPYASLPQMHIFTYDLGDIIRGYSPELEEKAFNFSEFFRVWTGDPQRDGKEIAPDSVGEFVHKGDIEKFLRLISTESEDSAYPFSTQEYRDMFRHTLWMIPGVKEAKALSKLLHEHPIFGHGNFGIANVAGEGDDYEETHALDALDLVKQTIRDNDYSITLSCGKLTTGVTIKEWTACFMLSGSYMTGAANYLQTIFRVQSPGSVNGKAKEHCYVFDFAPDRTLRVVAEAAKVSRKGGTGGTSGEEERRRIMAQFLNFCPVIAISGTTMRSYSVDNMMQQLKRISAEKVIMSGFEDSSLYNDRMLALDDMDIKDFEDLKKIIGSTKANKTPGELPVNEQGFTEEEYEQIKQLKKKKKAELKEEDRLKLEELKKQREEKNKGIAILRGVSVRMPLLIFGADVPITEDITIERFIELVDDESWNEFMPKGVDKELFSKFIKYYDKDVFVAAAKGIRLKAKHADGLLPTERVQQIALIHSRFKNPDKETVLTPWRVVNMHMSDCLGGYCFYDETFAEDRKLEIPRFVDQGKVTIDTLANSESKILEINSKTGLYPLYVAYSIYRAKCAAFEREHVGELTEKKQKELWASTIRDNLFVICKTPMAKAITKRTLVGYADIKVNAHYFDDLINQFKNKQEQLIKKVSNESFWNKGNMTMKFNAIVGNPPYHAFAGGGSERTTAATLAPPIYHKFVEIGKMLKPEYLSMIIEARWYNGGIGLDDFRNDMLNDPRMAKLVDYGDSQDCFPTVAIAGGICYFLWDKSHTGKCEVVNATSVKKESMKRDLNQFGSFFVRSNVSIPIIEKVMAKATHFMMDEVSALDTFGIPSKEKGHTRYHAGDLQLLHSVGSNSQAVDFISPSVVKKNHDLVDKYKVKISIMVPQNGEVGINPEKGYRSISSPQVLGPGIVDSQSYLNIGFFDTELEANNYCLYMQCKFPRYMMRVTYSSVHIKKDNFIFVPKLDFTKTWTDKMLYEYFELNDEEMALIEKTMRPMTEVMPLEQKVIEQDAED